MIITNLLTNMVILTLQGVIPTNTAAFQDYALRTMITNAQVIAAKWNLDQTLIVSNKITSFKAVPYASGLWGILEFGNRYGFSCRRGQFVGFGDHFYDAGFVSSGDDKKINKMVKKWLATTNLLSLDAAKVLAISAIRSIGLTPNVNFGEPRYNLLRLTFEGESRRVPYYIFDWKSKVNSAESESLGFTNQALQQDAEIEVSGINGRVVGFEQNSPYLRMASPTNYLKMLGLASNTIFVKEKFTLNNQHLYESFLPLK